MKELKALEILQIDKFGNGQIVSKDSAFIKEAIAELEALQAPKTCDWKLDEPVWNTYKTVCGQYFNIDGDLKENYFKFCTYCG